MLNLNQIYNEDCLEGLKKLDDHSIDLLVTDPPYGISFISGQRTINVHGKIKNDNNLNWLDPLLVELKRVLKPDAHLYIFCSHHHVDVFKQSISHYFKYKNLLVWAKNHHGMGDLRGDYSPKHELILFFSNGKKKLNGKRHPNILEFSKTGNKHHPTEKPVDLIRLLIEKSSNRGDVVLDCFMGAGSTALACIESDRSYIGFEIDESYCTIANERIKDVYNCVIER